MGNLLRKQGEFYKTLNDDLLARCRAITGFTDDEILNEHIKFFEVTGNAMTNETSDSISKPSETNVHHRRNKSDTSTSSTVPQSEEPSTKQSIIPRFASYFTFKTSAKNDTDDNKNEYTRKSTQRPWLCRNLCCKLFFLICLIYVIMYVRPDYSIHIRNSIEDILTKLNLTSSEFQYRPGQQLAKYRQPSMPIIIIPGIVSTGLELWEGTECATGRFRHRFWTSMQMVDNIGRDHQCWLKHISLDLSTWYVA
ncbi:unnamed protein product [Rotaria sp. Silwood1]|nr:unnamed protein product [Rotaria sp. Silwood1]